ncbi:MAG TPA: succinyl-diaminopimelate desuccinylase [Alphaproteobacteria bacterium]|nr:succinyl-diaminopimelate desuccinylase [Alphaproteobacteria bacterium]
MLDPVELTRELIRRPSVTPKDEGALAVLEQALKPLGFNCQRLPFSQAGTADVDNLYARIGSGKPHFCFAGHSDVVPVGDAGGWRHDPFGAEIEGGMLYGRGASDMKGAIGAFAAGAAAFLARQGRTFNGSISLLITGDEEGVAINGTPKMLKWLAGRNESIDACVVGEPTSESALGDMMKIGRRGSMNAKLTVHGVQTHSAYPHQGDNPNHRLIRLLADLTGHELDKGTEWFPPSSLQVTTIDVGNPATNVIPAIARASLNIRFNDLHTSSKLTAWLKERIAAAGGKCDMETHVSGEAFLTKPGPLSALVSDAVHAATGRTPALSTTGGTSDARFICAYTPVVEFGLTSRTAHKVDECAAVADIAALAKIYGGILDRFFAGP